MYRNDLIRAAIVNKDLNKSTFSNEAGLGLKIVNKLWDGDPNIELPWLIRACEFLGIPLQRVFEPKAEEPANEVVSV